MIAWAYWKENNRSKQDDFPSWYRIQSIADYLADSEYPDFILLIQDGKLNRCDLNCSYTDRSSRRKEADKFRERFWRTFSSYNCPGDPVAFAEAFVKFAEAELPRLKGI